MIQAVKEEPSLITLIIPHLFFSSSASLVFSLLSVCVCVSVVTVALSVAVC